MIDDDIRYTECTLDDIPSGVIFDVPLHLQGQIIEVAYGGFGHDGKSRGDPYMRIRDRSDGSVTYYRRTKG